MIIVFNRLVRRRMPKKICRKRTYTADHHFKKNKSDTKQVVLFIYNLKMQVSRMLLRQLKSFWELILMMNGKANVLHD